MLPWNTARFDDAAAQTVGSASTLKVGLISFYEFASSGALLTDSQGSNTLTNNGTATSGSSAPLVASGNYVQLTSASSQWLSCASNASLKVGGTDFSLNFWMYMDSLVTVMAVSKLGAFGLSEFSIDRQFLSGHQMVFSVYDSSSAADTAASTAVAATTLYMVTCTYTSSSKRLAISLNNGTETTTTGTHTVNASGSGPLNIGNSNDGTNFWNGRIDQVGFWKKVLSAAEITQLYNGGNGLAYSAM